MANTTSQNPWQLDTVGAVYSNWVKLEQVELVQYTADTDFAILKDKNGKIVAILNGAADFSTVRTGKIGWVNGLTLDTLTLAGTGSVIVYVG